MAPENNPHDQGTSLPQASRLIELERAQIGHEIHDGLLPLIFAASAAVTNLLDSPPADADGSRLKLQQIAGWLDEAMQSGRRLLTQVYPPELVGSNWTRVAADTVERLFTDSESNVQWNVDPVVNEISPSEALAAYRIVVEATRNAITHGRASAVMVEAQLVHPESATDTTIIRVSVRDNGCGFDASERPENRFGIRSMMGRAELVGGSLAIESAPGVGTTVTLDLPHQSPHAAR